MLALPAERFEVFEWTTAKVAPDSHCQVKRARYSVPFRLLRRTLSVRVGEKTVEFYHGEDLVKTHLRRFDRGTSTDMTDLPDEKTAFYLRTPQVCLQKASQIGTSVHDVVLVLLNQGAFTHRRQAQGILRLEQKHGAGRLNTACKMALSCDDPQYRTIRRILDNQMDLFFIKEPADRSASVGAYLHGSDAFAFAQSPREV
ncbi:MAG: Mu transposase domain-containing protein [Bacillota bacterium]